MPKVCGLNKTTKHRSDTRAAVRSLVRSVHGLTNEISILRKYVLELRAQNVPRGPGYDPYRDYRDYRDHLMRKEPQ